MESNTGIDRRSLRSDCGACFGLCCVALHFAASDGFPVDKITDQPCPNLQPDFRCAVYKELNLKGLKGCIAYDCFGAGQKVAQVTFGGQDWRQSSETAKQMFKVFLVMRQLHELLWYLAEALTMQPTLPIHSAISSMIDEMERLTCLNPSSLMELDIAAHWANVNDILRQASELVRSGVSGGRGIPVWHGKIIGRGADLIAADLRKVNLRGANLRGAYLIAADLRGADLDRADLIGADFRDADVRGADFSGSIFLTQAQINAAKGDDNTKLPALLARPRHWYT